jgi:tRNA-Thr(GGU) m(6)t(6)A37 methyltransferase TsaA
MQSIIQFTPIGIIHTPFTEPEGVPVQAQGGKNIRGSVEVYDQFAAGLKDLDGFTHIMLLYHFHLNQDYSLEVRPFLDEEPRGLFATRAPRRPNPIGISVVRLNRIKGNELLIEDVDMVDGTPLLDIKPYVPAFDHRDNVRIGWLEGKGDLIFKIRADGRFLIP